MTQYRCPGCGYVYDEVKGAPREGFPAGTAWSEVPEDWCCPDCAVREKVDFEVVGASAATGNSAGASAATGNDAGASAATGNDTGANP